MNVRKALSNLLNSLRRRVDGEIWTPVFGSGAAGGTLRADRPRRFETLDALRAFVEVVEKGIGAPGMAPHEASVILVLAEPNTESIRCKADDAGLARVAIPRKGLQIEVRVQQRGPVGEPLQTEPLLLEAYIHMSLDRGPDAAYTWIEDGAGVPGSRDLLESLAQIFARKTVAVGPMQLRRRDLAIADPIDSSEARRERIGKRLQVRASILGAIFGLLGGWISSGNAWATVAAILDRFQ